MRLINANNLGVGKANPDIFERKDYAYGWNNALQAVKEAAPTIDQESLPVVQELREKLAQVTAQRDAAIEELGGVLAMADVLTDFVDDEIHPVVSYDLYLSLRDNVDAITKWEHEKKWNVPVEENATTESEVQSDG